jgi:hypothetical protein
MIFALSKLAVDLNNPHKKLILKVFKIEILLWVYIGSFTALQTILRRLKNPYSTVSRALSDLHKSGEMKIR